MDKRTCSIGTCPRLVAANGFCTAHYMRDRRGADMTAPLRSTPGASRGLCAIASCASQADSALDGAFCGAHRTQVSRHGRPYRVRMVRGGRCLISGCECRIWANGMCSKHAQRATKFNLSCIQLSMIVLQPNCDLCEQALANVPVHIDHDHSCCPGKGSCGECIRGVVCGDCNRGMGAFRDSPDILRAAIRYLGGAV